jgi:hypothetical protein
LQHDVTTTTDEILTLMWVQLLKNGDTKLTGIKELSARILKFEIKFEISSCKIGRAHV